MQKDLNAEWPWRQMAREFADAADHLATEGHDVDISSMLAAITALQEAVSTLGPTLDPSLNWTLFARPHAEAAEAESPMLVDTPPADQISTAEAVTNSRRNRLNFWRSGFIVQPLGSHRPTERLVLELHQAFVASFTDPPLASENAPDPWQIASAFEELLDAIGEAGEHFAPDLGWHYAATAATSQATQAVGSASTGPEALTNETGCPAT